MDLSRRGEERRGSWLVGCLQEGFVDWLALGLMYSSRRISPLALKFERFGSLGSGRGEGERK